MNENVAMPEEKLAFQAEVSRLLDIVANSLYSDKEIFLRELISNSSDACDRLRYAALTDAALLADEPDFKITLAVDKKAKTLSVSDNGIGMNRDELIGNLGTIARSGTAAFVEQADKKESDLSLIGKFGVGFYSAFMVANKVEVASRKAGEGQGWHWASDGLGEFTVSESDEAPARGTRITLHLRKDQKDFLEPERLRKIVKTYSDHIAIPVILDGEEAETLNAASAIWTRPKSEISDEQYKEFYHHVGHGFDEPWMRLHFKAEGTIEYTGLLFIPTSKPFDLFDPSRRHKVKLYVKRIFITDECEELLPSYLRFLRGVIDSEDLPLNVSREMLQQNPTLTKIRKAVVKRVVNELGKKADKAPDEYKVFWESFGSVLKEGLYEDGEQKDKLLELVRFRSTAGDELTSLAGYLERMKDGQEAIYYITGETREAIERSPQLEGFKAKGVEVLLLNDPIDEFWIPSVGAYQEKPLKSVTRGGAELDKVAAGDDAEQEQPKEPEADGASIDALIAFVKLTLKDQVKDVRTSERLTESAVCLVADEGDMDIHLERMLKQHRQLDQISQRILEINPRHPMVKRLSERLGETGSGDDLDQAAHLLLDQARILEGEALPDPAAFARRMSDFVARGLAGEAAS